MDTDTLFQKYTIEEIRGIEKKTRHDIERKKEDLRLMVGERYRDLIEAADTITDMKHSAEKVMQTVSTMQDLCQKMKKSCQYDRKYLLNRDRNDTHCHYSVAAQIKILLDMPERIWSALDTNQHLHATCLFLLARHVNTSLQLDAKQSATIVNYFPVLTRQWASISHFRSTILQSCREKLKLGEVSDQVISQCLCSILLLEDSTTRQVFNEFLLARTNALQEHLRADSAAVKDQICEVMRILTMTVHQIYAIFYSGDGKDSDVLSNLLIATLNEVTEKRKGNTVLETLQDITISKKYLPDNVKEFRPSPRIQTKPIESSTLQGNSQQWIETCIKTVNNGVNKLLGFVNSVKGLATIKNEIWLLLHEDEKMKTWDKVCEKILNRKLSLWEEFLRPLFCDRAKAILQFHFDGALDNCKQQVARVLTDIGNLSDKSSNAERDLSCYVWTESINDLPPNTAWVPVGSRAMTESGLVMKARAFTPAVQSLSKNLDNKLEVLLIDSAYYTGPELNDESPMDQFGVRSFIEDIDKDGESDKVSDDGPFNKFADREMIYTFLQNSCEHCITKLLQHLNQQLYACTQQLANSSDIVGNKTIIDRILLLGRFTTALSELSPSLQKSIVIGIKKQENIMKRPQLRSQYKAHVEPKWLELKQKLVQFGQEAFSTWINYTCKILLGQFETGLLDNRGQAVLHSLTKWDEIEIEEETEEGNPVKSVIRVPMQPSWYLQTLLYNVCEEINRIGGHALPRSILVQLANQLSDSLLDTFDKFQQNKKEKRSTSTENSDGIPFTQSRALQMWFDIKFTVNVFPRKDESEGNNKNYQRKLQKVLSDVETTIDPFDFDVFTPYMSNHLARQNQRNQVLYGALASLDQHSRTYAGSFKSSSGQQEQHNILPLTSMQNRFPLLPLSGHNRGAQSSIMEPPKPKTMIRTTATRRSSSPAPNILIPPQQTRRTSILDQMSTIWFNTKT